MIEDDIVTFRDPFRFEIGGELRLAAFITLRALPNFDFNDILAVFVKHHQIHPAPSCWQFKIHIATHHLHKCVEITSEQVLSNRFPWQSGDLEDAKSDASDEIPKVIQQRLHV